MSVLTSFGSEQDPGVNNFKFQVELLIYRVVLFKDRPPLREELGGYREPQRPQVVHDPLRVYVKVEPALSLHRVNDTVRHAVRDNQLHVAAVKVLKVVLMRRLLHRAVIHQRPNIKEEVQVHHVVVDLGWAGHPPVNVELATLAELRHAHIEHLLLVVGHASERVRQSPVENPDTESIDCVHGDVLHKVKDLVHEELVNYASSGGDSRFAEVNLYIVKLRVEQAMVRRLKIKRRKSDSVLNLKVKRARLREEPESILIVHKETPILYEGKLYKYNFLTVPDHLGVIERKVAEVDRNRRVPEVCVSELKPKKRRHLQFELPVVLHVVTCVEEFAPVGQQVLLDHLADSLGEADPDRGVHVEPRPLLFLGRVNRAVDMVPVGFGDRQLCLGHE